MIVRNRVFSLIAGTFLILAGSAQAGEAPTYTLSGRLPLPGPVRWDYLAFDTPSRRLFVTRGDSVEVLDVETQNVVGTISQTLGVHGVALADDLGLGFTSNGKADTVTVFDLSTFKPVNTVPVGNDPDAIVYDSASRKVLVADGHSNDVTVIDAVARKAIGTVKLDGGPEYGAVDGAGHFFIHLEDKAEISVIDIASLRVIAHHDLSARCQGPTGMAIDKAAGRLFSVCANKVMVVSDAMTGGIIATLPVDAHSDAAAFDPQTGLAFASNGDGTLTVVGETPDGYRVVQTVATQPTARTMALDPDSHAIYLAAAETEGFDPPSSAHPEPRPHLIPGSFEILTVSTR